MVNHLVTTEKQLSKQQTGLISQVAGLGQKIITTVESSTDKTKDKEYLNSDLFAQMTYMAAISSSGLSRRQIIDSAADLPYCSSSYFKDINSLVQKLNFNYPEACRMVGERTMEATPRAILLRMAGTFTSGEPERIFLAREAFAQGETYGNAYERDLQSLKSWTDAYISLTLSASLIIIVAVISMMIYPVQNSFVYLLSILSMVVTIAGAWVIHRAAPKEIKTHGLKEKSKGQRLANAIFKITMPFAVLICSVLALTNVEIGWILLIGAVVVVPPGTIIMWDDRKIDKHDSDISGVLRSLGGAAKAISSTVSHAASKLDPYSTASFRAGIQRLQTRLATGLNSDLCWLKFVSESGSELVHRSVKIFRDAVNLGADPQVASEQASMYAMKIDLLREKRKLVSSGFSWLCMVMHMVVCVLMLFICGVLQVFSGALTGIEDIEKINNTVLPTFGFFGESTQIEMFGTLVMVVILVYTLANAFAIRATTGGHYYKFLFFLGIMMAMSGICFLVVPHIVGAALSTMAPLS